MDLKLVKEVYSNIDELDDTIVKYYNNIINGIYNILIQERLKFLDKITNNISKHVHSEIYKDVNNFNKHFRLYKKSYYSLKPIKFKKFNTNYPKNIEKEIFKKTKIILLENPVIDKKYDNINDIIKDYKKIKNFNLSNKYLNNFYQYFLSNYNIQNIDIIEIIKLTTILTYLTIEFLEVGLSNYNNLNDVKENINLDEELKQILSII